MMRDTSEYLSREEVFGVCWYFYCDTGGMCTALK